MPSSLSEMLAMCEQVNDCWLFPRTGNFACTVPDNDGGPAPRNAPHRWAWMVANNRMQEGLPSNVTVRHRCHDKASCRFASNCAHTRCCNPAHLYLSASGSKHELSPAMLEAYIDGTFIPGPVFGEDLEEIAAMCDLEAVPGCWLFTTRSMVPCRNRCDNSERSQLPKFTPHRWTWAVAHGRTVAPIPSSMFHIRRRCGQGTCCNPDHLYVTGVDGAELTLEQVDRLLEPRSSGIQAADISETAPELELLPPRIDTDHSGHPGTQSTVSHHVSHSEIRLSYTAWIASNCPVLSTVASEIAVSIHPWPDFAVDKAVVNALVAELHPAANLCHPDIRLIAADRLLRMVDVAGELDEPRLTVDFLAAAHALDAWEPSSFEEAQAYSEVLHPLLSMRTGFSASADTCSVLGRASSFSSALPVAGFKGIVNRDEGFENDEPVPVPTLPAAALGCLLPKVAMTGSRDLGVLLGGGPVGFDVANLAEGTDVAMVLSLFTRYLSSLSERDRDILVQRHFNLERPPTLDSLGRKWGVTRERARQIARSFERSVDAAFGDELRTVSHQLLSPLHDFALPTADLHKLIGLFAPDEPSTDIVTVALLNTDGTWVHDAGWSTTVSTFGKIAAGVEALKECTDGYWSVSQEDASHYLTPHFLRSSHLESYLRDRLGWVAVKDRWSLRGSKRNQIATALWAIGRPATKAEIAQAAGVKDVNQVSNHLGNIPEVVRADKERWAFAGWVEDPYDGIVGEIEQRIDSHGGAVRFELLLEELPAKFGVSASSVKTYVATDAFILDHGLVRRNNSDYVAGDPRLQAGATKVGELWGQRVVLHQRHFEGYSLAVSFDIAYANGLRPGDDILVPTNEGDGRVSVSWQRHNPSRTVFIGRVARMLTHLGCASGQTISLVPCRNFVHFVTDSQSPVDRLDVTTAVETPRFDVAHHEASRFLSMDKSDRVRDPLLDLLGGD